LARHPCRHALSYPPPATRLHRECLLHPRGQACMTVAPATLTASVGGRFRRIRRRTMELCADLSAEDLLLQSMPDASPGKWHLAHTTWFFEQFVLGRDPAYRPRDPAWSYLFNSYYQSVGPMHARPRRGMLSRPSLEEVRGYRHAIDDAELAALVELGVQHEQQHQELLLTDIKHAFWCNPLQPAYRAPIALPAESAVVPLRFVEGREGIVEIGHRGEGFAFDNETPRHRVL